RRKGGRTCPGPCRGVRGTTALTALPRRGKTRADGHLLPSPDRGGIPCGRTFRAKDPRPQHRAGRGLCPARRAGHGPGVLHRGDPGTHADPRGERRVGTCAGHPRTGGGADRSDLEAAARGVQPDHHGRFRVRVAVRLRGLTTTHVEGGVPPDPPPSCGRTFDVSANGRKERPPARVPAAARSLRFAAVIIHRARPPPSTSAVTTASTATIANHTVSLRSFQGTGRARSMESAVERAPSSKAQRSSRPTVAITPAVSRARARAWAVICSTHHSP